MPTGGALPIPGWVGGDGNSAYLDKTLRHQPVETVLDDRVSGHTVIRIWMRAALIAFLAALIQFPILLFTLFNGSSGSGCSSPMGTTMFGGGSCGSDYGGGPDLTFLLVMMLDVPGIFILVLLFSKLTEPIGEWRVLLHDRSEQDVQSTYHKICGVAAQRQFPLGVNYRRLATGYGGGQLNSRLALSNGDCEAVISVFRYGTSLYLGWQMWRTRRGWRLIVRFLVDVIASVFGKADLAWVMLRTENVRAMREAVHSLCREGLTTALEQQAVGVEFGFGSGQPPQAEYPRATGVVTGGPAPTGPLGRATAAPIPGQTPGAAASGVVSGEYAGQSGQSGQYAGQAGQFAGQYPGAGPEAATAPSFQAPAQAPIPSAEAATAPSFQPPAQAPIPGPVAPTPGPVLPKTGPVVPPPASAPGDDAQQPGSSG